MNDNKSLFSETHKPHLDWSTRIQIGEHRFYKIERMIDWIRLRIIRPKLTESNFEYDK